MIALTVFSQMISLFLIVLVAVVMTRRGMLDAHIVKGFSNLLSYFALPAMILHNTQAPFSMDFLSQIGISFFGLFVNLAIGILLCIPFCLLRKTSLSEMGAWMCCAAFPNTIYIGRPIMLAIFGQDALLPINSMIIGYNIYGFSIGVMLMTMGRQDDGRKMWKVILKGLCNPTLITCCVAFLFFLFSVRIPSPILNGMEMLSYIVTPVSMMVIGYSLGKANLKVLLGDARIYILSFLRLVACPLLTFVIIRPFLQGSLMLGILLIATAMPVGATVNVLSEQYDNHVELCARTNFFSTLLCIVTAPLIALLLRFG